MNRFAGISVNPFSTRFVRPGAIPFVDDTGLIDRTIECWRKSEQIGQIVGPHGSGKTVLTLSIEKRLIEERLHNSSLPLNSINTANDVARVTIRAGMPFSNSNRPVEPGTKLRALVQWLCSFPTVLHTGEFEAPDGQLLFATSKSNNPSLLVIDGIERLGWLHRKLLMAHCRSNKIGLLVTTHRPLAGLPIIAKTNPEIKTFRKLVAHLLQPAGANSHVPDSFAESGISSIDLDSAFRQSNGDFREALMKLYDVLEQNRPRQSPTSTAG